MARVFFHGDIIGEPDPVIPTIDWVRSELDYAKTRDVNPYIVARITTLSEVLYRLEREQQADPDVASAAYLEEVGATLNPAYIPVYEEMKRQKYGD
jgi:hypothetical protein